ncbi:GNAT family N-acetyltransferase [Methanoregula sp.]|uniref:GNAT family N-acetyltransferase n=1 Tax=Methanoregula sp. TaxID=2052170 RepID=UPI00356374E5
MMGTTAHELLIRQYRDEDFTEVTALESAGVHEYYRSAVFVRQMAALSPATFLVAVSGTTVVGFTVGTIVQDDPAQAWILRMMVRDGFRHQGIGTALLRAATGVLHEHSVKTIYLTVAPKNEPAVRLYRREGFEQESLQPAYFGGGEDRFIMKWSS